METVNKIQEKHAMKTPSERTKYDQQTYVDAGLHPLHIHTHTHVSSMSYTAICSIVFSRISPSVYDEWPRSGTDLLGGPHKTTNPIQPFAIDSEFVSRCIASNIHHQVQYLSTGVFCFIHSSLCVCVSLCLFLDVSDFAKECNCAQSDFKR